MTKSYKEIMPDIKCFIFDVDGVLTDGKLHVAGDGKLLRQVNAKDGYAIKLALEQDYKVCLITAGNDEGIKNSFRQLGVTDIYMNAWHKVEAFEEYIELYEINPEHIAYMGDDLPDIPVLKKVGLATARYDASFQVQEIADYVSQKKGGEGCVRDLVEQIMRVQQTWPKP